MPYGHTRACEFANLHTSRYYKQCLYTWEHKSSAQNKLLVIDVLNILPCVHAINLAHVYLQDVSWHVLHDSIFGSVADDQKLMMLVCLVAY